jgi:tRNA A-37 threonylcarbamoyl transferase component Bud32
VQPANDDADKSGLLAETLLKERYRIIKPVGQGGMGTVYHAQDTELNDRAVAVKEMIVSGLSPKAVSEATEAFTREATLLAALQHPNLPSVFEHFQEDGRWYMVMSFIQGETLEAYLTRTNRNKLPLSEVLSISKQLCTVLHYLHSQYPPIIFRDVKPANIMRAPDGQIYLIDFGVARRFKPGQKKDTIPFGSIGYAPPEQFNKTQTTPRADIYSLGATMYQLLSGHEPDTTPFHFPPFQSLEPTMPTKLVALIEQMLDMDEMKRPLNMLSVEQRLQEISADNPSLQAFSAFALPQPAKLKRRRALRTALMLSLAVACMVVGGFIGSGIGSASTYNSYQTTTYVTAAPKVNATATAQQIAALPDPYSPKGTLALVDPLNQAGTWQEDTNTDWGGQCQFKNNILQVSQTKTSRTFDCGESINYTNFTVQVDMTILKGNCGGLYLRDTSDNSQLYAFDVCADGTYAFYHWTSNTASNTLTINSTNLAIKKDTQTNTIAVVANGSNFDLYVNGQKIESVNDTSYKTGTISLIASANNDPTTVTYQNAVIWTLP